MSKVLRVVIEGQQRVPLYALIRLPAEKLRGLTTIRLHDRRSLVIKGQNLCDLSYKSAPEMS